MARDLREDAARAVVREAQRESTQRLVAELAKEHAPGLAPPVLVAGVPDEGAPGPTLAEMVADLREWQAYGEGPNTDRLIDIVAEIDRRLTALEGAYTGSSGPPEGQTIAPAPELLAARARWVAAGYTQCPTCATLHKGACPLCSRAEYDPDPARAARAAFVPGHDAPCSTFVRYPEGDGCGRCGFVRAAHHG